MTVVRPAPDHPWRKKNDPAKVKKIWQNRRRALDWQSYQKSILGMSVYEATKRGIYKPKKRK